MIGQVRWLFLRTNLLVCIDPIFFIFEWGLCEGKIREKHIHTNRKGFQYLTTRLCHYRIKYKNDTIPGLKELTKNRQKHIWHKTKNNIVRKFRETWALLGRLPGGNVSSSIWSVGMRWMARIKLLEGRNKQSKQDAWVPFGSHNSAIPYSLLSGKNLFLQFWGLEIKY